MKAMITICVFITLNLAIYAQNGALDEITNVLCIQVEGGEYGFRDEAFIHFAEGATTDYDIELDAKKWFSLDPEATMIWTVSSDDVNLAINNLPIEDLHSIMNSIPLHFVCGYNGGEYTLKFSDLESFDHGIEIWLEDTETEEGWIRITATDTLYNFTGIPDFPTGRFMIHILDPMVVDIKDAEDHKDPMTIYAANNTICVKNTSDDETIKQIQVYDISGREVYRTNDTEQQLLQFELNVKTGIYLVCVITQKSRLTEKIYLKKH